MIRYFITAAVWAIAAGICFWRAKVNWREYKAGRGKPLLAGVSRELVENAAAEWPLREVWWPPPNPGGEDAVMEPWLAHAYARLAERTRSALLIVVQVMTIVGGSWLGITLPAMWADYRRLAANEDNSGSNRDVLSGYRVVLNLHFLVHFAPALVIAAAMMLLMVANSYAAAAAAYTEVARIGSLDAVETPKPQVARPRRGIRRLLSWLN